MEETQFIAVLYDHLDSDWFITAPLEELIVEDDKTGKIIFYCTFYQRVKKELHQTIPAEVNDKYYCGNGKYYGEDTGVPSDERTYSGEFLKETSTFYVFIF